MHCFFLEVSKDNFTTDNNIFNETDKNTEQLKRTYGILMF